MRIMRMKLMKKSENLRIYFNYFSNVSKTPCFKGYFKGIKKIKCIHAGLSNTTMNNNTRTKRLQREAKLIQAKHIKQIAQFHQVAKADTVWKEIPENPNYRVFEDGRIWSMERSLFLKPSNHRCGYQFIGKFYINGKKTQQLHHRVVARAFLGECPANMEVSHIDNNKLNNAPRNLEYVTRKTNMRKAWSDNLMENTRTTKSKGEKNGRSKLTEVIVREIHWLKTTYNYKATELAKMYNISSSAIHYIMSGRCWGHLNLNETPITTTI
jgi:hypothetical protein